MSFIEGFECFACGSTLGKMIRGSSEGVYCFVCCASKYDILPLPHEFDGLDYKEILSLIGVEEGEVGHILSRLNTPGKNMSCLRRSGRNLILEHLYYTITGTGTPHQSNDLSDALCLYLNNLKDLEDKICS